MSMFSNMIPRPAPMKAQSHPNDLQSRLSWGEPALTILDVRNKEAFNQGHIQGAVTMPMERLVESARSSLEPTRDIYIYGETDEETAEAAQQLRNAGFVHVSELIGGLASWKAMGHPVEAISAVVP